MSAVPAHLVQRLEIPLAWGEQDAFGHLNNVVYFRYMESVRMYFLDRIGVLRSHNEQGIGFLLANSNCDFLRPVRWPADLIGHAGCSRVGNSSFTMEYLITDALGEPVAKGKSVQVMYDYRRGHTVPVPPAIRDAIARLSPI